MSHAEKHIVDTYFELFSGLSPISRIQIIERLTKSLKTEDKTVEKNFYKSFGAFASNKSAEEIISDIKASRKFKQREIEL